MRLVARRGSVDRPHWPPVRPVRRRQSAAAPGCGRHPGIDAFRRSPAGFARPGSARRGRTVWAGSRRPARRRRPRSTAGLVAAREDHGQFQPGGAASRSVSSPESLGNGLVDRCPRRRAGPSTRPSAQHAVGRPQHPVAEPLRHGARERARTPLVVHDEHHLRRARSSRRRGAPPSTTRQEDPNDARRALAIDPAGVLLDDAVHDGEPEARAVGATRREGSNMRSTVSGGMLPPVSVTSSTMMVTVAPGTRPAGTLRVETRSPPSGIASRAFTHRFMSACPMCAGSTSVVQRSGASERSDRDARVEHAPDERQGNPRSSRAGPSAACAVGAPAETEHLAREVGGALARGLAVPQARRSGWSSEGRSESVTLPMIAVSRLLNSCAMPPAKCRPLPSSARAGSALEVAARRCRRS